MHYFIGAVVGVVAAIFCPALARKAKARISKEVASGKTAVLADVQKVESKL